MSSQKKVVVMGSRGFLRSSWSQTLEDNLACTGENTGNLVFQYGLNKIIDSQKINISHHPGGEYVEFSDINQDDCDYFVMPAANHLRPDADWTGFNWFLRQLTKPLIVVGLGAQAPAKATLNETLEQLRGNDSILEFARLIDEKSIYVGFRGEYSAEVGKHLGITNGGIIGCPSLFISKRLDQGNVLQHCLDNIIENTKNGNPINSFTYLPESPYSFIGNASKSAVETELIKLVLAHRGFLIQQSGGPESINYYCGRHGDIIDEQLERLRRCTYPGIDYSELLSFFKRQSVVFFSAYEWAAFMETQLFSIGHRFHGNMLTTGTNRPGIVILHDERTSELSNGLQIPRISQKNFMEASKSANPLLEMLSQVEFDSTQFQKTRKLLAAEWVKLSNVTGVKISDYVGKIAGDVN
jgi:hypothetical protein